MKIVRFDEFGPPHQVADCVDTADPGPPGYDEVVVEVEAFPINPVDLLTISGNYAVRPPLPAVPGSEGVGRVAAAGAAVSRVKVGDRVLLMGRENWTQKRRVKADTVRKVPSDADVLQLAMLKVNPATAQLMLRNIIGLKAGEWVIQDAANSGVGSNLIRLANSGVIRTVNVVRRDSLVEPLRAIGADVVLVDGEDLAGRVAEATANAHIRLAIDAVGGPMVGRLAGCLAEGGTVVNYGLLSGEPCRISSHDVVFRGITLRGFWLFKALGAMNEFAIAALYDDLAERLAAGQLRVEVERTYPMEDIKEALSHAQRQGRGGKILVTPNGELDS